MPTFRYPNLTFVMFVFTGIIFSCPSIADMNIKVNGNNMVVINGKLVSGNCREGDDKRAREERPIQSARKIILSGAVNLEVNQSSAVGAWIEADGNLLDLVRFEQSGDAIAISTDGCYSTKLGITVVVNVPQINDLVVTGSGDVVLRDLEGKDLKIVLSSSGNVFASGAVDTLKINLNGSGDIHVSKLTSRDLSVNLHGSGDIYAFATESVHAILDGSGDILVAGTPHKVTKQKNGSGRISLL